MIIQTARVVLLFLALLFSSGCITQKVQVLVRPDGSGHLLLTETFSREMVGMAETQLGQVRRQMEALGMENEQAPKDPFYNEDFLKARARCYGPDVTFVKAQKIDQYGARGAVVLYAFTNVATVRVPMQDKSAAMSLTFGRRADSAEEAMDTILAEENPDSMVTFGFTPGERKVLTVHMPAMVEEAREISAQTPPAAVEEEPEDESSEGEEWEDEEAGQMAELERASKELRIQLVVEVKGEVLSSNAAYPDPGKAQRVLLYDLPCGNLTKNKQNMALLRDSDGEEDVLALLLRQPGIRVDTNQEVRIEFK